MNEVELIQGLIDDLNELPHRDEVKLDYLRRRTLMIIGKVFGDSDIAKQYKEDISKIEFNARSNYGKVVTGRYHSLIPGKNVETTKLGPLPLTEQQKDAAWISGKAEMLTILGLMLDESKLEENKMQEGPQQNQVFVVHGHDREMKLDVAWTLEKLSLKPIILDEKANEGQTIIEKFEKYSDVNFAVVLLSPDDKGCSKSDFPSGIKARVRQNVIFELGYFINKLGRSRVAALYRGEDIEIPSDYNGVMYIRYDSSDGWKLKLVRELKECGYDIDMNKL